MAEDLREYHHQHLNGLWPHKRLAYALTRRGFVVKRVTKRDGGDCIWELSLRAGTVDGGCKPAVVRRCVASALADLGFQCPAGDVEVLVTGDLIQAYFIWYVSGLGSLSLFAPVHPNWKLPARLRRSAPAGEVLG